MSDKLRPFVLAAVRQAMSAHEINPFNFYDAMHAAERMYSLNWKRYRESKGMWTSADEKRAANYPVPSGVVRKLLDTNPEILRTLASRDQRLPLFRDKLGEILEYTSPRNDNDMCHVIAMFIQYAASLSNEAYPWKVTLYDTLFVFPGKDVYAIWVCLQDMIQK